jgi:hypothetical protein
MAATSISFELITRVREFYTMAYQEISSNDRKQATPDNGITDYAIPSYILSVAAVEAFINEMFLAFGSSGFLKGTSFEKLSEDDIQKFRKKESLGYKLIELPKLAFDQDVFNSNTPPFQDMNYLIKVRDSFVHYKMGIDPEDEGIFDYLVRKGVAINSPNDPNRFWVSDLSTFEGIRWAHNTALKIISDIIDTAIKTNRHQILISMGTQMKNFFHQIPDPNKNKELWLAWMNFHYKWKKVDKQKAG